ncbi:hypothetical protein H112_06109 [Trichophyton rubrum D6]|nr:hypothetical protein H112_06109 [Trichophyton rubrum D6]
MPGKWCFEYRCKILRETQFRVGGSKELLCVNGLKAVLHPGSSHACSFYTSDARYGVEERKMLFMTTLTATV